MQLIDVVLITLIGAALNCLLTGVEIPMLKKLKAGQSIREEGPQAHLSKAGTPTMGGLATLASMTVMCISYSAVRPEASKTVLIILFVTLAYGGIGFWDDYLKVVKHQNEGLNAKQKMGLQIVVGVIFSVYRFVSGNTSVLIPGVHHPVEFGLWIIPFSIFVLVAMTNAVNLSDGLDGLSSSVAMNASFFTGLIAAAGMSYTEQSSGDTVSFGGNPSSAVCAFALCGCCIGFLVYNHHPAKVFMGDTGSLAIGACLSGIAMTSGFDFSLPVVGLIYVIEALSVIIQVIVFKTQNGRRFFRMAPIHHHFELGGWSEVKVDTVFSIFTVIMGLIGLWIFG